MNPATRNEKSSEAEHTHAHIGHAAECAKRGVGDAVDAAKGEADTTADRAEKGLHHAADVGAHAAHRMADNAADGKIAVRNLRRTPATVLVRRPKTCENGCAKNRCSRSPLRWLSDGWLGVC